MRWGDAQKGEKHKSNQGGEGAPNQQQVLQGGAYFHATRLWRWLMQVAQRRYAQSQIEHACSKQHEVGTPLAMPNLLRALAQA